MAALKVHKLVAALPGTLEANAIYAVRTGAGFDLYMSDSTGAAAHALNGAPASVAVLTVEVESIAPFVSKFFEVSVPGVLLGDSLVCSPSLDMPAGVSRDELEDDPICVSGSVTANGIVTLLVASAQRSPIGGKRNINLVVS